MPPRDEESRFERVLARHLRRGEAIANCPDAETLAAYHERGLTAEEMNAFKGHIAACGRCQELLAGLEASEGVTAGERDALHVADFNLARPARAMEAAAAMPAARELGASPAPAMAGRPKRTWKWMAPAAAVAAGILVWVGVQQTRRAPSPTTTVAVNKQPTVAGPPSQKLEAQAPAESADRPAGVAEEHAQLAPPAAKRPASLGSARKEADELTAQVNTGSSQELNQKVPRQDGNANTRQYSYSGRAQNQASTRLKQQAAGDVSAAQENLNVPAPQSPQVGMESGKKDAGQKVAMDNAPNRSSESSDYRAGQLGATEKAKRAMQEEQQKQAQADKDAGGFAAAATMETKPVETANAGKNEKLQQLSKPAAAPQATSGLRDREAFYAYARSASGLVLTPDKGVMWHVGEAGMILKTVDGGSSWTQQVSGVSVELLAGSAPSERICWAVGRGGTILRTMDGEHWQRIASPTKSDLIGIDARDAQTAVVWASEKLPRYVTRDAGKTWQRTGAE